MEQIFLDRCLALLGVPIQKNSASKPVDVSTSHDVDKAVKIVDCNPTPFQLITENYRKAHLRLNGLLITIENPKGSMRRKLRPDGSVIWESEMQAHYGYIKGTVGADFDQVDCFVGDHHKSEFVYIIDQKHKDSGKYDESKCFIWFKTAKQAMKCYFGSFSDGSGKDRFLGISGLDFDSFKHWMCSNATLQSMTSDFDQAIPDQGKRGGRVYPHPPKLKSYYALSKKKKKDKKREHDVGLIPCEERTPVPCAGYPRKKK